MGKAGGAEVDGRTPAGEAAVHVAAMADAPISCTPLLLDGTLALSLAPTLSLSLSLTLTVAWALTLTLTPSPTPPLTSAPTLARRGTSPQPSP